MSSLNTGNTGAASQIHDLGHAAYDGPRTTAARRVWAIARNVFGLAWKSRWAGKLPMLTAAGTTLTASVVMYILRSTLAETVRARGVQVPRAEMIVFFAVEFYSLSAFLMSIMVAAAAVADDLRMGSFLFYFARPIRVRDYLAGKLLGLGLLIGVPMFGGPLILAIVRLALADDFAQALRLSPVLARAALLGVMGTAAFVLPAVGLGALVAKRQAAQAIYVIYFVIVSPAAVGLARWLHMPIVGALSMNNDVSVVGRWLFAVHADFGDPPVVAAALGLVLLCAGGLALVIARVLRAETAGLGERMTAATAAAPAAIECADLSKWYGQVLGVSEVNVRFDGGIIGLLGPNGAGKSTLIKCIAGLMRPSRGSATIHGASAFGEPDARRRLGYCPEHEGTYEELTALELVAAMAEMSGVPRSDCPRRAEEKLTSLGLADAMNRRLRGYSRGMRQRAKLAQALVHKPDVLLLDEPLNGCDPLARAQIIGRIQELGAAGATVVISSHVLHEIESLTQQIVVLFRGRVLAEGDVHQLRELIDEHPHRVRVECARARELAATLVAETHVSRVSLDGDTLEIETRAPDKLYAELPLRARQAGIKIRSLTSPDDNLEAVFEYLTARKGQ